MKTLRTYLDPIHREIILDLANPYEKLIADLIDTPEFQRLRRIHQLGITHLTFQGAEGSRFTHSLGVMQLARRFISIVEYDSPFIKEQIPFILASALLHDIGHGPFSHVTEKILGLDHEDWSCKIISDDTKVHEVLDKFSSSINLPATIIKILKKVYYPKYVSQLISSQMDLDRFDYLLRDTYLAGTSYGLFALDRILHSMAIDQKEDRILIVGEKGQVAVEDYLFSRYSMYTQVYYHKKNLAAKALLASILTRAQFLITNKLRLNFCDTATQKWLLKDDLQTKDYLQLDDIQLLYHIKRWTQEEDTILQDLSLRFIDRRLPKTVKLNMQIPDATLIENIKAIMLKHGYDPDYYLRVESTGFKPYDYYRPEVSMPQTNIMIKTNSGLVEELSKLSKPIEAMTQVDFATKYLTFPSELEDVINSIHELNRPLT